MSRSEAAEVRVYAVGAGRVRALGDSGLDMLREIFGLTALQGIPSGAPAALQYPASAAAIRIISGLCASAPLHAYRRGPDGGRERLREHDTERLLLGFANPWTPADELIRGMTRAALLEGHGFAKIVRTRDGRPIELHQVNATVERDKATGEPSYRVQRGSGATETLPWQDVLHLVSPTGGAPAKDASRAIKLGLLLEQAAVNLFENGGRPAGLISMSGRLTSDESSKIRTAWKALTGGENAGAPAVLGSDAKFTPMSMTSTDAEHLENRRLQISEVLRHFGLPPTLAGELEDASLNNAETLGRQALTFMLAPWLQAWVGAVTRALVPPADRASIYVEHEVGALTAADMKATAEALKLLVAGPIMTANDARARLNQPAIEGGDRLYPVQGAAAATTPTT